ncbi:MAG: septum formation initiator family protein [Candidatus Omnitrophota bacterium]|nr:septum formation initiator family protein [Candidatus Omnitrophota bacterium]
MAKIRFKPIHIAVAAVIVAIFIPGYIKFIQLKVRNMHLEGEISRLEKENLKLYKEKKRLEEDINYVEKVARESMGVTKKGEIPIRIER